MRLGFRFVGTLHRDALERALNGIVERHSAFRMAFLDNAAISGIEREQRLITFSRTGVFEPGVYSQFVMQQADLTIREYNLSAYEEAEQNEAFELLLKEEYLRHFQWWSPPLIRAILFKINNTEHVLILVIDHIICDGFSLSIIRRDLKALYRYFSGACSPPPESDGISFPEFVSWQNRTSIGSHFNHALNYWRDQWATFGSARLACEDFSFTLPHPKTVDFVFATEQLKLNTELSEGIRAFSRKRNVTPFMFFFAGFAFTLSQYTGKTQIGAWSHFANRIHARTRKTVGYFVNSHLLGVDLSQGQSSLELLEQVKTRVGQAIAHQEMPLPYLWRVLRCAPRYPDPMILMDFTQVAGTKQIGSDVDVTDLPLRHSSSPRLSALAVHVVDNGEQFTLFCKYTASRFRAAHIQELLGTLSLAASLIITDPKAELNKLISVPQTQVSKSSTNMGEFILLDSHQIPQLSPLGRNGNTL